MGNGRATALTFAREGAKVLCVDHNLDVGSRKRSIMIKSANQGTAVGLQGRRHQGIRHQEA
jgi:NAD(P)-dependent dehydrogenase (short-subunit alcohol dehydrogenase family)